MPNTPPSGNPANLDTLVGAFKEIFGKLMQNTDGMLPAQVIAYQAGPPPRVQVQPLIQLMTTSGEYINRARIASIPVLQLGGGGFFIHFPISSGDLGWILANDRDISQFLQSYEQSNAPTFRRKNFSDALFIPDVMRGYTVSDDDADNLILGKTDGSVKISIGVDTVTVSAPNVTIDGAANVDITSDTEIDVSAPKVRINAATNIIATTTLFAVSGNITAGGTIQPGTPPPPP